MQTVYLVIGCPGSGKTWVCEQLKHKYHYVSHDENIKHDYVKEVLAATYKSDRPVLIETPFSISQIKDPLETKGIKVVPVFIQESTAVLSGRYRERESKPIPTGHLTRQQTYLSRAREWGSFTGTSTQVLEHLKGLI